MATETQTKIKKSKTKYINAAADNKNLKWYVLSTIAGHEKKVLQQLEQRVKANGLENKVAQVIVPTQDKVIAKEGKKLTKEERFLPGYVLIHVELDEDTWKIIRYTDGVTGFLGSGKEPESLSEKEVAAILALTEVQEATYKSSFSVGNPVKVIDGIFKDLIGTIQEIHEDKGQLTVLLSMFGREVPTKLDFLQVTNL
jgi:transcriptional antiterminator NusG